MVVVEELMTCPSKHGFRPRPQSLVVSFWYSAQTPCGPSSPTKTIAMHGISATDPQPHISPQAVDTVDVLLLTVLALVVEDAVVAENVVVDAVVVEPVELTVVVTELEDVTLYVDEEVLEVDVVLSNAHT